MVLPLSCEKCKKIHLRVCDRQRELQTVIEIRQFTTSLFHKRYAKITLIQVMYTALLSKKVISVECDMRLKSVL